MRREVTHLTDEEILLAADGELSQQQAAEVQAHLLSCWTCRTRMGEIDSTIADFVRFRANISRPLPASEGPRAVLKLRMGELEASSRPAIFQPHALTLAAACALAALLALFSLAPERDARLLAEARAIPDPNLTPGVTLPLTRQDVCAAGAVESVRIVPAVVARKVFAAYGIEAPKPRAYEVDYLITPALGGSDNIRNFWPQPYRDTAWSAHVKDALEDYMRELVCGGQLELATAQHEIAQNWIAAYKKYFQTERPLPQHVSFLKDRPWE